MKNIVLNIKKKWIGSLEGCKIVEGKRAKKAGKQKQRDHTEGDGGVEPSSAQEHTEGDDEVERGISQENSVEGEQQEEQAGEMATRALDSTPSSSFPRTADGILDAWIAVMRAPNEDEFLSNWDKIELTFPEQTCKCQLYPMPSLSLANSCV
ncbi:hypothetical protein E4U09_000370 [Claviceps aff. purpurea]|uniref:Uncharacterized protein n=1 Tax=Claviceps aff. purpurea TaxID=1967640 RepID=A0A9P7TZA4_9HYPO|nr:hypothetical protein E4U09_000370 [Claviceps aff. purpurea]